MTTEIKLRKGQRVLKSCLGHRGFYYPSEDEKVTITIQEDCTALHMTGYVGTRGKTAFSIPTSSVAVADQYDPDIPYMVIWK